MDICIILTDIIKFFILYVLSNYLVKQHKRRVNSIKKAVAVILLFCILYIHGFGVFAKSEVYSGELDYAGSFSGDFAVVGKYEGKFKYGYIDKSGKLVIDMKFDYCEDFSENLAKVGIGEDLSSMKYGYIKTNGSYLIKPQFDIAYAMHKGYALVGLKKGKDYKYGLVSNKGKIVVEPKYDYIDVGDYLLDKGYAITSLNSQYGLVNLKTGKIIEPKYKSIALMSNYIRISSMVDGKEKYGFILFNGKVIEPAFDWIHHFGSIAKVIGMVEIDGKFGLMGADGKYVLEPKYDEIREFNDGITHVKLGDKYGYVDSDGSFLTDIEFEDISAFSKGISYVKKNGKWGLLNIDGTYKAEPIYDSISLVNGQIEAVLNGEKKLLNLDGSSKFDNDYVYMYPFVSIEGASKVMKDGKEVIIDAEGKPIFKKDFDKIWDFVDGVARIELKGKVGYLTIDDKYLVEPIYDSAYKDEATSCYNTKDNELWGLVLTDGTVIKPMSDAPIHFYGDYGIIRVGQKKTYIDKKGKRLTNEVFDDCYPFSDGFGRVTINGKTNYLNTAGKLMNRNFDFGQDFKEGFACVYDSGRYRFIDKNGNFAFGETAKFLSAKSFSNGLAAIYADNGKWGYIDTKGKIVIQPQFEGAFNFDEKLAPVIKSGKIGFIDKTGKFVIQPVYESATEFENGLASVWKNCKYSHITSNGEIKTDVTQNKNYVFSDGVSPAKAISPKDGMYYWGYIKTDGSWLVKPELDYASPLTNGKGYVWKDNRLGDITKDGKIVWQ